MATYLKTRSQSPPATNAEKSAKISAATVTPVKMVIPFGLQCEKCGRRTYKGDRCRALREESGKDPVFDVEIYRFHLKCPCCRADFAIKSDPGRYDYVLESGATLLPKKFN